MNAHIEHAVAQLARAEATLQAAHQRHEEALEKIAMIEGRIQTVIERRVKVRADLTAGTLSDREAGGLLAASNEDHCDLQQLLADARSEAQAAAPMAEEQAVMLARDAIERIGREYAFDALHARVLELERAFLEALGGLYQQGQTLGRGRALSGFYQPSDTMRRALFHGVPPVARASHG